MNVVVTPSKEVVGRAEKLGWKEDKTQKGQGEFIFESGRRAGLCLSHPFSPIHYIGTVTFLRHKIRRDLTYALTPAGPVFSGYLIKDALKILGRRRVRVFVHRKTPNEKNWVPLLLGTNEGTVAIAPRVPTKEGESIVDDETEYISDYIKTCTGKFKRGIIFGSI